MNNIILYIGTKACCGRLSGLRSASASFVQQYNKENTNKIELRILNSANLDRYKEIVDIYKEIGCVEVERKRYDYAQRVWVTEKKPNDFKEFVFIKGVGLKLYQTFNLDILKDLVEGINDNETSDTTA